MKFITRTHAPIAFINISTLITSKRLVNKKIKHYRDQIRGSTDEEFIKVCRNKIRLLKEVSKDLKTLILDTFL